MKGTSSSASYVQAQESQDASEPYFLYTYDPTLPRAKDKLFKFLRKLPKIFDLAQLSDLDIIIENGALVEEEIDQFVSAAQFKGRTTVGLGGTYILTIVSPLHEAGRSLGDTIVSCVASHVAHDLANRPKDPPSHDGEVVEPIIESEAGSHGNVESTQTRPIWEKEAGEGKYVEEGERGDDNAQCYLS